METLKVDKILRANEFSDFYQEASNFCEFLERDSTTSNIEFLNRIRENLLNLYNKALKLQWVDLQSNIEYEDKLDNKEFENILNSLANKLDDKRYYWHVFDPTNQDDTEPVCGDLVDDLGDIYKDIKFSIMTFNLDKKDCKENALWQFKFDFDKHWDDHCINALSAIHFFLQNE